MEHLRWGVASGTGPIRAINEDRCRAVPIPGWGGIFAVFDGAGGMVEASMHADLALEVLIHHLRALPDETRFTGAALRAAVQAADEALRDHNARHLTPSSGGTLALAMIRGHVAWIAWVGDCRIWRWSGGRLAALTREHLLVHQLLAAGRITPEEVATNPYRSIVLRALVGSPGEQSRPDTARVELSPGDTLILATDGLWQPVSQAGGEAVAEALRHGAQRAAEALLAAAHAADGRDNAAVVVVEIRSLTS